MKQLLPSVLPVLCAGIVYGILAGCTPSVRYTRPGREPGGAHPEPSRTTPRSDDHASAPDSVSPDDLDFADAFVDSADSPGMSSGCDALKQVVDRWLGVPYRRGGTSRRGIDCSAFTQEVYRKAFAEELPRTVDAQRARGRRVGRRSLEKGDLVFFRFGRFRSINHVGVYMGNSRFAHASSSRGVTYSSLENRVFVNRYAGARRIRVCK